MILKEEQERRGAVLYKSIDSLERERDERERER